MVAVEQRAPTRLASRVVVTGVTGGVGATSVALHLAHHLATTATVCLVDLDAGRAAERLGIDPRVASSDVDIDSPVALRLAAVPVAGGFRLLVARGAPLDPLVQLASDSFERLVIDVPRHRELDDLLAHATAAVVVLPPSEPAARRAAELVERHPHLPIALVLNRLGPGGELTRAELERTVQRRITLELPCAPRLRDAEDERSLIGQWTRWDHTVRRLAAALERG